MSIKVTWIGQAGLLFDFDGFTVMVDPYLSNSCESLKPENRRRIPVDGRFLEMQPDVLVFTHNHMDHYDPETAPVFLDREKRMTVLSPGSVWQDARKHGGKHNYVLMSKGTVWTEGGVSIEAVPADHSDPEALGFVIQAEGRTFYVTGDTLYNRHVVEAAPWKADYVFLPVNGVGNNMNATDAALFANDIRAKKAVPLHIGMMDDLDADVFDFPKRFVLEPYKETEI